MINVTDLRNGKTFLYNDTLYKVLEYSHIKTSRGGATVKVKVLNILDGAITIVSFSSNSKVNEADLVNVNMQYLYDDEESTFFMHPDTYEQVAIKNATIQQEKQFLREGEEYQITLFENVPIGIVLPVSMVVEVINADGNIIGSSGSTSRYVIVDTGAKILAPSFIKVGEKIKINTQKSEYTSRAG